MKIKKEPPTLTAPWRHLTLNLLERQIQWPCHDNLGTCHENCGTQFERYLYKKNTLI